MFDDPVEIGDILLHVRKGTVGMVVEQDNLYDYSWIIQWSDGDYGSLNEEAIRWFRHEAEALAKQNGL